MLRTITRPAPTVPTAYVAFSPSHGLWTVTVYDTRGRTITRMGAMVDPTDDMIRASAPGVTDIIRKY